MHSDFGLGLGLSTYKTGGSITSIAGDPPPDTLLTEATDTLTTEDSVTLTTEG